MLASPSASQRRRNEPASRPQVPQTTGPVYPKKPWMPPTARSMELPRVLGQAKRNWRKASSDASVDFKRKSRVLLLEMLRAKVASCAHPCVASAHLQWYERHLQWYDMTGARLAWVLRCSTRRRTRARRRSRSRPTTSSSCEATRRRDALLISDLPHRRAPTEGRLDVADGAPRRAHSPCSVSSRSPHAARLSLSRGGSTGSQEREQARLRCTLRARAGAGEMDVETFLAEESEVRAPH